MSLTRSFRETIQEQLADPAFRSEFLREAVANMTAGDLATAESILREYVTGTSDLGNERDRQRNPQIAAFNQEIIRRLASLDRGEHVNPADAHRRIKAKSKARRKTGA